MRWAIAFHPDHVQHTVSGRLRLMVPPLLIPEDRLAAAVRVGWIALGSDSDLYPDLDANLHSNPHRHADEGDDA